MLTGSGGSARRDVEVVAFGEALVSYRSRDGSLATALRFTRSVAGAELNFCVGVERLGVPARWISVLGDDAHGSFVRQALGRLGLDTAGVARASGSTAVTFKASGGASDARELQLRSGSAYALTCEDMLPPAKLLELVGAARHLHLSAIPLGVSASSRRVAWNLLEVARQQGMTVSLDTNLRPELFSDIAEARQVVNAFAARCDLVLPGLSEGRVLTGAEDADSIARFYLAGAVEVVIKDGARGARAFYADGEILTQPVVPVDTIDTVGAGDGFAAGYVAGLLRGLRRQERLRQAATVGALVTTRPDDADAMPTRTEVHALEPPPRPT